VTPKPAPLRQWCRECQQATESVPCLECDGQVCAGCAPASGGLCQHCAIIVAIDEAEG
jgi:hypothetical protein